MKTLSFLASSILLITSVSSYAEPPSQEFSHASKHSALAMSHGSKGSAQVASGVVAVPIILSAGVIVGTSVAASAIEDSASDLAKSSTSKTAHKHDVALEITEITITVDQAPKDAMKSE